MPAMGRPRSASNSATISATAWTCSGLSTLVSISAATPGITAASRSRTSRRHGRLTRTSTSPPLRATCGMASAIKRAGAFLLRRCDRVLQVQDDAVSTAVRAGADEFFRRDRNEQEGTPGGEVVAHGSFPGTAACCANHTGRPRSCHALSDMRQESSLTASTWPVMQEAAGDARNTAAPASSFGCPQRLSEMCLGPALSILWPPLDRSKEARQGVTQMNANSQG